MSDQRSVRSLIARRSLLFHECTFYAAVRNWALDTGLRLVLNRNRGKIPAEVFSTTKICCASMPDWSTK